MNDGIDKKYYVSSFISIHDWQNTELLQSSLRGVGTTGARGTGPPYVLTGEPCPCYFVSWHLLIKLTKNELT